MTVTYWTLYIQLFSTGLLAMPKGKTAGGLSFEVVDATVVDSKPENDNDGDVFVSSQFIPSKTLARLELRRGVRAGP